VRKSEICSSLGEQFGFTRYLEICTTTTGNCFADVFEDVFDVRDRLIYRCDENFDDGLAIAWRTESESSTSTVATILDDPDHVAYDVVFVDSFHTYASSLTDLYSASMLVSDGGVIVVHDVLPSSLHLVNPDYQPGSWCGATFQAYVDFPLRRTSVSFVIDADFGCGVIMGPGLDAQDLRAHVAHEPPASALRLWQACHSDVERFDVLAAHRTELHQILAPSEFRRGLEHQAISVHPGSKRHAWVDPSLHTAAERDALIRRHESFIHSADAATASPWNPIPHSMEPAGPPPRSA